MLENGIALLCQVYSKDAKKQKRVLELLRNGARNYYRRPESRCTTWSYFTPYPPSQRPNDNEESSSAIIGGMEIYDSKTALQAQVDDEDFFQAYHQIVKEEGLYTRDEELVAWYFSSGFIARNQYATPFGNNTLISLTHLSCKPDRKEVVLQTLGGFVPFVKHQEIDDVLTYAIFTRPKAANEVMVFGRYKNFEAAQRHQWSREHGDVVKQLAQELEGNGGASTTLWKEIDDSFVSTQAGGPSAGPKI